MSEYVYRMSLAVPQALMAQANQLALLVGESAEDNTTFATANRHDKDGNLYAVCSAVVKPIVLSLIGHPLVDAPLDDNGADIVLAQQAMDAAIMYSEGVTANPNNIFIAIDVEPTTFFEGLGLTMVEAYL